MDFAIPELIIAPVALAGFVVWIWALVDALGRPDSTWEEIGHSKLVWIIVLIFLGFVGGLVYFLTARRQLAAAENRAR